MALGLTPKEIIDSGSHPLLECSKEWERIELQEIAEVQNGFAFKSEYFNHESGLPLIRIRDVGKSEAEELYSGDYDDDYLVDKGDILIGMDGDFRAAYWIGEPGLLNQRVCRIRNIDDSYSKKFLYYLLQPYLEAIHAETSAVTVKHLSSRTIQSIPLPNPPLPTQNRIVEKIEELFSELDNGVENLKKAQKQLKTYRQAVLKDAFEGKLTKEWREQQDDLSTPEELLQQIKAERKAHRQRKLAEWEKEVEQWEKDGEPGRKPRKPRKVNEVEPIAEKKLNKLAEIPDNWLWVKLGRVIDQPKYGTSEKCDYDFDGYGVLRIPNIDKGVIDAEDMKYAPLDEDEASKYALQEGDILTIRSNGSIDLVGKCALIREPDTKFLHAGYLIRLRPYKAVADSRYLLNVLSSVSLRSQIESKAKSTSGVNNINSGELQDLIIPISSTEEQKEIVNEIESRLSVVDQLEQTIKENLQKAEALRQSILKKAFSGELVEENS